MTCVHSGLSALLCSRNALRRSGLLLEPLSFAQWTRACVACHQSTSTAFSYRRVHRATSHRLINQNQPFSCLQYNEDLTLAMHLYHPLLTSGWDYPNEITNRELPHRQAVWM